MNAPIYIVRIRNASWVKLQKWFMASVLTDLAIKMVLAKIK